MSEAMLSGFPKKINENFTGKVDSAVTLPNGTILMLQNQSYWLFDHEVTEDIVTDGYPRYYSDLGDFGLIGDHVDASYTDKNYVYLIYDTSYVKLNSSLKVRIYVQNIVQTN